MDRYLKNCLFPVMLGSNALCHACVRKMQRFYGSKSTVLTGGRALTLRFLPFVRVVDAPPDLPDDILLEILSELGDASAVYLPVLILCDPAYGDFVFRNRDTLQARFILRNGAELTGENYAVF